VPPEGSTGQPLAWSVFLSLCLGLLPAGPGRAQSIEPSPPEAAEPESPPPALPTLLRIHTESVERGTRLVLEGNAPLAFDYASPDPQDAEIELLGAVAPSLREGLAVSTPEVETVRIESLADPGAPPKVKISVHLTRPLVHRALARGDDVFLTFTALPGERLPDEEEEEEAAALGEAPPSEPPAGAATAEASPAAVGPAAAVAPPEASHEPAMPPATPAPEVQQTAGAPADQPTAPAPVDQPKAPEPANQPTAPPPAAEPALAAGPSLDEAPAATRLMGIGATFREGKVAVRLHANGRLRVHDFYVDELPHRLVLDLDGIENHVGSSRLAVDLSPVQGVRVAQYSVSPRLVTRVVVDLSARVPYRIEEHADGLTAWIDSDEPMPQ
jgi:hypothetical protein